MKAKCKWFLRCPNDATTTVGHPVLGRVRVCERCYQFATGTVPRDRTQEKRARNARRSRADLPGYDD